jgi:hypothetical protein
MKNKYEELINQCFTKDVVLFTLKENVFRARVIEYIGERGFLIIKVSKNKLDMLKMVFDEFKPVNLYIKYEPLKWYQGWLPRYKFLKDIKQ